MCVWARPVWSSDGLRFFDPETAFANLQEKPVNGKRIVGLKRGRVNEEVHEAEAELAALFQALVEDVVDATLVEAFSEPDEPGYMLHLCARADHQRAGVSGYALRVIGGFAH